MAEPICKIARENGGQVPLSCAFGCHRGCQQETERRPLHLAKEDLTCRSCGADCYWQEVIGPDAKPKARLFEGGKPHVCKPSADDFDVVGG